jgi:hypothetical protein
LVRSGYPDERIEPFLDDLPGGQRRVSQGHSPAQLDADPVVSVVSCVAPDWSARGQPRFSPSSVTGW